MDIGFFNDILSVDSTSGKEADFALFLSRRMKTERNRIEISEVGDGTFNLLISWGEPKLVFCTHMDTVPPYIPPHMEQVGDDVLFRGRGTCDAKGQIMSMWTACLELEAAGFTDFALLLLAGEETGSFGAKAFRDSHPGAEWVIVGEPTDNCMASASKGTKAFELTFNGVPCHSGYPENGISAVMMFNDFMNALRSIVFPNDEVLGETTWNVGRLVSDNPQNILSDSLSCRVYFRTTFESDMMVCNVMKNMAGKDAVLRFGRPKVQDGSDIVAKETAPWQEAVTVKSLGGDSPTRYEVLPGFDVKPVAFGSDAPQLSNFSRRILCGPGSILTAHTPGEQVRMSELQAAAENYVKMYHQIMADAGPSQH